jgi:hypothetical protein
LWILCKRSFFQLSAAKSLGTGSAEKELGQPLGYPIPFSPVSASTFALLEAFPNVTVKRGRSVLDESPVLSDEGTRAALQISSMLPSIKLFSTATKVIA